MTIPTALRSAAVLATALAVPSLAAEPAAAPAPAGPGAQARAIFQPLPAVMESSNNPITAEKVELGRMLYFDKRLSKNHDVSCNTCHDVAKYGVDGQPTSPGHKKQRGGRNSPTVYNAGVHVAQFWDGRAPTLEEQAKGPILNPIEMAHPDAAAVEKLLRTIPGYADAFKKAFPTDAEPITYENMAKAIGAFERKLVTPGRWDKYLAGDDKALTAAEQEGLALFMATGCTACHMGAAVGGNMFQKYGLVKPVEGLKDNGRFDATKNEADRFFFKVPSLRNIDKTGPYLHDGSVKKLDDVVVLMARHQLGKELQPKETKAIVTFLKALTGDLPKGDIKAPKLPPSSKDTPKPDPS